MIVADSSVWIDHLRSANSDLQRLLESQLLAMHVAVLGEIAMGTLKDRKFTLRFLKNLPRCPSATDKEVLDLVEREKLFGLGIGFVDAHILASVVLTDAGHLWTRDRRLKAAAERLSIAAVL